MQVAAPATNRSQLRDQVAEYVRELIVSGQAPPGRLLRLAPLAESLEMSITPVREALLLLGQDGWVEQKPNRGFCVAEIRRQDVADAYLVHSLTAGELAARATGSITRASMARLRALDEEIRALEQPGELHVEELNYQLHDVIYDAADSPRLKWFVKAAARFVPRRFWTTIPGWLEFNRAAHGPIIDLLERGDAEGSRRAMTSHIEQAGVILLEHLDALDFWGGMTEAPVRSGD